MKIEPKFNIGEIVFLITDHDQYPRLVTGILVRKDCLIYNLQYCTSDSYHYDYEIASDKNFKI